jgi:hypothetical protein
LLVLGLNKKEILGAVDCLLSNQAGGFGFLRIDVIFDGEFGLGLFNWVIGFQSEQCDSHVIDPLCIVELPENLYILKATFQGLSMLHQVCETFPDKLKCVLFSHL